jgi:hypothetical protein
MIPEKPSQHHPRFTSHGAVPSQAARPAPSAGDDALPVPPTLPPARKDAALRLPPDAGWDPGAAAPTALFDHVLSAVIDHLMCIEDHQLLIEDAQQVIASRLIAVKHLVEEWLP